MRWYAVMVKKAALVALGLMLLVGTAPPRSRRSSGVSRPASRSHRWTDRSGCARNNTGRIRRSPQARSAFIHSHPCPSTGRRSGACPGYVVDHVIPLKRGGADSPWNMQWQTKAEAKAKDKVE